MGSKALAFNLYCALAEVLAKVGINDIPSVIDQLVGKNCGKYADMYNEYKSLKKKVEELKKDVKSQKSVADLYLTIASSSATKMSIAKAVSKEVCDEIRSFIDNENYELWGDNNRILSIRADDFNKILDKIEKEIANERE